MDDTIWLLLWTLVFGFIAGYRYGSGRAVADLGYAASLLGSQPGQTMPDKDIDPVCRESVSVDRAKASIHEGKIYHFCSRECREIFEAAPPLYLTDGAIGAGHSSTALTGDGEGQ